ncbi:MAG: glycosyltransferase family 4 protein [Candidatus Aureabacteria bacterium]|nr:glycosyltransferase family 4 protein [Candidatus Auribacterota bacterium]
MRLLFLNHNLLGQGTFLRCNNIAVQLAKQGHRCTLVCVAAASRYRSTRIEEHGIEVLIAPSRGGGHYQGGGWGILDILTRMGALSLKGFDLVYAFDHKPSVALPALLKRYAGRVPLISDWADWWCRGGHMSIAHNFPLQYGTECFLEENTKRWSDGVTTICAALRDRARALGIPEERLLHLPSGADIDRIRPMDRRKARESLGMPRDIHIVGCISANLLDADMLLEAMAKVFAVRRDCRLLFLGPGRGWHRDLAVALGIDSHVIWAGFQPYHRIAEFIACADLMALPMRDNLVNRGRWPNRIGEHMAAGRATACCAVGDMIHLFGEERIGVLSSPDVEDYCAKVLAILDDPRAAEEMGARAREAAERRYSWKAMAVRFCEFLGRLPETSGLRI